MAIYYVAPYGSDSNAGTSISAPWATLAHAASNVGAGNTCLVRGGVYTAGMTLSGSGTASSPIIFRNFPGEIPIVNIGGAVPPGGFYTGAITISGNYNIVSGFFVTNSGGDGFDIDNNAGTANNNVIKNCTSCYNVNNGINVRGSYNIIANNNVYANCQNNAYGALNSSYTWGSAVSIGGYRNSGSSLPLLTGNVLCYNTIHGNWGEGLYGYYGIQNTTLFNNTVYNNWNVNIGLADSINGLMYNNLSYFINAPQVTPGSATSTYMGMKCAYGGCFMREADTVPDLPSNNIAYNNLVYGLPIGLANFQGDTDNFSNNQFYFNTVINPDPLFGSLTGKAFVYQLSTASGTVLENNILMGSADNAYSLTLATEGHNNWLATSPGIPTAGSDIYGDATGWMAETPGSANQTVLSIPWFSLLSGSPCIGAGVAVSGAGSTNALGVARASTPNIGAL